VGEKQNQPFQLLLNASLEVDFQGSRVTSDGGLILVRELDEPFALEESVAAVSAVLTAGLAAGIKYRNAMQSAQPHEFHLYWTFRLSYLARGNPTVRKSLTVALPWVAHTLRLSNIGDTPD